MDPLSTFQKVSALYQAFKDTTRVSKKSNIFWWTHIPRASRQEHGAKLPHAHTKSRWSTIHRLKVALLAWWIVRDCVQSILRTVQ